MDLSPGRSDVFAGVAGIAAVLIVAFALRLPIWLAVIAGVVVYVAARFLIPAPREVAPGLTHADVSRVLQEGKDRLGQIQELAGQVPKRDVRAQVSRIAEIVGNIYADFKSRPSDINQVPDFAPTYLDPLINVLTRYVRLAAVEGNSKNDATLAQIESDLLPKVESNFNRLYHQLLSADVVDLDAASEGLKSLLDLGGT
jgi:5-bromo-4-chloroindolyl phosphate hydrolysis protein